MAVCKFALAGVLVGLLAVGQGHAAKKDNAKARAEAARKVYQGLQKRTRFAPGGPSGGELFELLFKWSSRWAEAQAETVTKKRDRLTAWQGHVDRMRDMEETAKKLLAGRGLISEYEVTAATYYRLEAEKKLSEAKRK
jgi:hypothetical protein